MLTIRRVTGWSRVLVLAGWARTGLFNRAVCESL
jgi:hypothetical protein